MYKKDFNKGQCGVPHVPPSGCPQEAALEDKPGNAALCGGTAGASENAPETAATPRHRNAPPPASASAKGQSRAAPLQAPLSKAKARLM